MLAVLLIGDVLAPEAKLHGHVRADLNFAENQACVDNFVAGYLAGRILRWLNVRHVLIVVIVVNMEVEATEVTVTDIPVESQATGIFRCEGQVFLVSYVYAKLDELVVFCIQVSVISRNPEQSTTCQTNSTSKPW